MDLPWLNEQIVRFAQDESRGARLGACPSNLLLRAAMLSLRAECSKNGLCGVASATPPRLFPALPLSRRPPRARDGHYSDGLLGTEDSRDDSRDFLVFGVSQ